MKKTLKMVGVLVAVLGCVLLLASCGKCRHKQTDWFVEKEATCTIIGQKVERCLDCEAVLNTKEIEETCRYQNGICVYCGEARYGNEYLAYREIERDGVHGYEVTGRGNCASVYLEIPTHHKGKPVLAIAAGAFAEDEIIKTLVIEKNVREIGDEAFAECINLTEVVFVKGENVKSLGASAFRGCTALTAFAVPRGVLHLSPGLLEECAALATLTLHDGLLTIGENALLGCDALQYTTAGDMQFLGTAENPQFVLIHVEKNATAVAVPDTVKIVAAGAFSGCTALTEIALPEGVLTLGSYAFSGCSALTAVSLPATLTLIGDNAFAFCRALTTLTLPRNVTEIGAYAFKNCEKLTTVTLPASLISVGDFAFLNTALTEIVLPATLTRLGACAFSACENLRAVTFEAQTGWKIAQTAGETGVAVDVTNAGANATALTGEKLTYFWYR